MSSELQIPQSAPVMILPGCNFFPSTPLPLHIFEPRYRMMLAMVLEGERMFCIGTRVEATSEEGDGDYFSPDLLIDSEAGIYAHGTIGMVRACVRTEEGMSNLILEGVQRVRFSGWLRDTPFRIAELEPVGTHVENPELIEAGVARLLGLSSILVERGIRKPPELELSMETSLSPETVADVVANYFISDLQVRHQLLAIENLNERIDLLSEALKATLGAMGPPP